MTTVQKFAMTRDTDKRIKMLTTIKAQGTAEQFLQQLINLSSCDAEGLNLARIIFEEPGIDDDDGGSGDVDGSDYTYDEGSDDERFFEPERPKGGVEESKGSDDYGFDLVPEKTANDHREKFKKVVCPMGQDKRMPIGKFGEKWEQSQSIRDQIEYNFVPQLRSESDHENGFVLLSLAPGRTGRVLQEDEF